MRAAKWDQSDGTMGPLFHRQMPAEGSGHRSNQWDTQRTGDQGEITEKAGRTRRTERDHRENTVNRERPQREYRENRENRGREQRVYGEQWKTTERIQTT